jgi:hypothetical protein
MIPERNQTDLVPTLSEGRPAALSPSPSPLSYCPTLSEPFPDNPESDLVCLSPPLGGDKVDKLNVRGEISDQVVPTNKGISLGCSPVEFASRPLFLRERDSQIYGNGIPLLPHRRPYRSFDSSGKA